MQRMQRVCGRSRKGTVVPLCVRLQGEVVCGRAPRDLASGEGTDPLASDLGGSEQPLRTEPSPGKTFTEMKGSEGGGQGLLHRF